MKQQVGDKNTDALDNDALHPLSQNNREMREKPDDDVDIGEMDRTTKRHRRRDVSLQAIQTAREGLTSMATTIKERAILRPRQIPSPS